MSVRRVVDGVYQVSLTFVNAFLIDADGLTLLDTGLPGSSATILQAVRNLGRKPGDVRRILLTHCHVDHSGSLAELKRLTGAVVYMHPLDAALVRRGRAGRSMMLGPPLVTRLYQSWIDRRGLPKISPAVVDVELQDGQVIEGTGGLTAINTPGHTAGHMVFLSAAGVLFVGDAASRQYGLRYNYIYENRQQHAQSLDRVAHLDFDTACFSHGKAILHGAVAAFAQFILPSPAPSPPAPEGEPCHQAEEPQNQEGDWNGHPQ